MKAKVILYCISKLTIIGYLLYYIDYAKKYYHGDYYDLLIYLIYPVCIIYLLSTLFDTLFKTVFDKQVFDISNIKNKLDYSDFKINNNNQKNQNN